MLDFALGLMALLVAFAAPVFVAGLGFLFFALGLDTLGMHAVFREWCTDKLRRMRNKGGAADE